MSDILRDIGVIARALDSIANIEFKELALTRGQYLYLVRIDENPGIIPDRLADLVKVDRTTASRAINKLVKQDFIEKNPDPDNRKIKRLFPTDKGKEAADYIRRENRHSNGVALEGLTQEEKKNLSVLLEKVKNNIEADWKAVKQGETREY
ncbi:DNA-binding transcriptional regulator, MarR family [Alkalibacterium putridalgicola]|uniref:DNA-binding transcriptional regulator, MarR family n=1 Tax=Alkalibacterium putridalgicola TaxID=426703 RepID=A0A1H7TTU2_9LACT|nr:MarR family transcriptional regulator [Alkalibacterium putridalgicola]GEK90169.1 putative HTH-type transcriptional regulator YybA [Alkalibacterium putridalgicola]SEL87968.1 DNA-binding transcriptional regulator, MarR family [Alkalibacterium putridalgicola]